MRSGGPAQKTDPARPNGTDLLSAFTGGVQDFRCPDRKQRLTQGREAALGRAGVGGGSGPPPQLVLPPAKGKEGPGSGGGGNARLEKAKQRSAQQELKQRQRAEIYALNRVMTELEQQQFDAFCKQMRASSE
ncbi:small vasohibin-binding protein [Crotalus adamanteus]|uniref:Small vasohibin-binding protein n=1 Tax=Crotalus adamanteus TaxID=8729 RepID=A0AAW1AQ44_CROAD